MSFMLYTMMLDHDDINLMEQVSIFKLSKDMFLLFANLEYEPKLILRSKHVLNTP